MVKGYNIYSEKSFLHGMQDFTEYTGKDTETLLNEAEED
jgi:hypothetical protein